MREGAREREHQGGARECSSQTCAAGGLGSFPSVFPASFLTCSLDVLGVREPLLAYRLGPQSPQTTMPQDRQWWRRRMSVNSERQTMQLGAAWFGIHTGATRPGIPCAESAAGQCGARAWAATVSEALNPVPVRQRDKTTTRTVGHGGSRQLLALRCVQAGADAGPPPPVLVGRRVELLHPHVAVACCGCLHHERLVDRENREGVWRARDVVARLCLEVGERELAVHRVRLGHALRSVSRWRLGGLGCAD